MSTCQYAGKTYKEGERFYPAEQSCLTCICKQGFNGKIVYSRFYTNSNEENASVGDQNLAN